MTNENLKPIVLDIETSGLDFVKCGIWQIGAIDLNTMEKFLEEARIDYEDKVEDEALMVTGKTEEELRDENKQSQKELLKSFFKWIDGKLIKNFLCQNPPLDIGILRIRANKYGLKYPFHKRSFDLHTISQMKFHDLNKEFSIKGDISDLDLTNILNFCGIEDKRGAHNALEDCNLTAECFSRLVYGKNLFPEFNKFEVPGVLKK